MRPRWRADRGGASATSRRASSQSSAVGLQRVLIGPRLTPGGLGGNGVGADASSGLAALRMPPSVSGRDTPGCGRMAPRSAPL